MPQIASTPENLTRTFTASALTKLGFHILRLGAKVAPENHPAKTYIEGRLPEVEPLIVTSLAPSRKAARAMRFVPAAVATGLASAIAFVPSVWHFI